MIEKLLAELSKATVWMPAQVLKDKVGARNTTNVSLRLRGLEKNGSAVSRSRTEAGAKIVEWRHADKVNAGDLPPAGRATKAAPVVQDSLTTEMPTDKECCNAAKVVATTAGTHVAELRAQLKLAEQQRDEHYHRAELFQLDLAGIKETVTQQRSTIDAKDTELGISDAAVDGWLELAKEFECKSIPELRVFINAAVDKLDRLRSVKAENTALTILNESMPGFGAVHKALSGRAYLVRIPKKAPRVFSKRSNAEAAAMSAAKQRGTVNVFALVPVGKAVRGAEWQEVA